MAWFRGRNKDSDSDIAGDPDSDVAGDPDSAGAGGTDGAGDPDGADDAADGADVDPEAMAEAERARRASELQAVRAQRGPWDESEATERRGTIDLGALRLPARQDLELRLEVQDTTRVVSVTVSLQGSALQLQAFAAPRTSGVWDDIRTEIAAQVTKQGGSAEEVPGEFGTELLARLPVQTADGRTGHQPRRFVGVDGPRWFVRGVFTGPAAHDPEAAVPLDELLRGCVVVRGTEARPPRELLPLKLPPTAAGTPGTPGTPAPGGTQTPAAPPPTPATGPAEGPTA